MSERFRSLVYLMLLAVVSDLRPARAQYVPHADDKQSVPFSDIPLYDAPHSGAKDGSGNQAPEKVEKVQEPTHPPSDKAVRRANREILLVNNLGDPKALIFRNVSLFPERQLRRALSCDLKYQAAARPSNSTGNYLSVLETRLREGYLHCGCADTEVGAYLDSNSQAIVVHVEEGPQFRKGQIRVIDSKTIDEQAIIKLLTTPQLPEPWTYSLASQPSDAAAPEKPAKIGSGEKSDCAKSDEDPSKFWKSGDAFDFRETALAEVEPQIRRVLADLGYAGCRFYAEEKRNQSKGVVDLQITMLQDVPRTRISKIEVTGLERDSRKSLLKYLQVAVGDVVDAPTLQRIDDRLTESCRYWTHSIVVSLSPDDATTTESSPHQATLRLELEEYAPAPPLEESFSASDEMVRKCAAWLKSVGTDLGGNDVVCTTESINVGSGAQQAQFGLGSDGTLFIEAMASSVQGIRANHTLIFGPSVVEIYDWDRKDKFSVIDESSPQFGLQIATQHSDEGKQEGRLSVRFARTKLHTDGASDEKPGRFHIEPVALLHMVKKLDAKEEFRDGIFTIKNDDLEIQLDEKTGAIRAMKGAGFLEAGVAAVDFKSGPGLIQKMIDKTKTRGGDFPNRYSAENPLRSLLGYAAEQVERQPMVMSVPSAARICKCAEAALRGPEMKQFYTDWTDDRNNQKDAATSGYFEIPGLKTSSDDCSALLTQYLPYISDKVFPRGSWPWTACREAAFAAHCNGEADDDPEQFGVRGGKECTRMIAQSDSGPVSALIIAQYLRERIEEKSAPLLLNNATSKGLGDLSDEAFLRDVHILTKGDHSLAVVCRALAEHCGELSEEDQAEIMEGLPEELHEAFQQFVARRKTQPNESAGDSVEAVLLDAWHGGLKDVVATELHELSTPVASAAKVDTSTK